MFLDRFSIRPGVDFLRRLTEDLAARAFLLLIETEGIRDSPWVEHEISYAASNDLGKFAVTLPAVTTARDSLIDEFDRYRLSMRDVRGDTLASTALDVVLERIELSHAHALRRRRSRLLSNLIRHQEENGCECSSISDWSILGQAQGYYPKVFLIVPRRPRVRDLRKVHQEREQLRLVQSFSNASAAVVHYVKQMSTEHTDLLRWVADPRELAIQSIIQADLDVIK